jgi:hypothetical protein
MALNEVVGGVFIAPQTLPSRWQSLLAMGASDSSVAHRTVTVHCPVRATLALPLGFEAVDRWSYLSFCCTDLSSATPDSLVTSDFCAVLFTTAHLSSRSMARREPLLRWLTVQSDEL